jgi:hypothetical protein
LLLQGSTSSNNGDVSGNHGGSAIGDADIWVAKMCNGSPTYGVDSQTSCDPYTWIDGVTYTTSNYSATHIISDGSINGCDSIVTLNLNLIQDSILISDSSYNSYTYNGQVFYNSGVYLVDTISNGNGCITYVYLDLFIYNSSLQENTRINFLISPNPTSHSITIKGETNINQPFSIFDQMGREVFKGKLTGTETEVNLSALSKGMYSLKIEGNYQPAQIVKE